MTIGISWHHAHIPNGPITQAYKDAVDLLDRWAAMGCGSNLEINKRLIGWPRVDIVETIARELLRSRGYDQDLVEHVVYMLDPKNPDDRGEISDCLAELDRTRKMLEVK